MLSTLSISDPLMVMGSWICLLPPEVHHELLGFVCFENEVDLAPLVAIIDQPNHSCVIGVYIRTYCSVVCGQHDREWPYECITICILVVRKIKGLLLLLTSWSHESLWGRMGSTKWNRISITDVSVKPWGLWWMKSVDKLANLTSTSKDSFNFLCKNFSLQEPKTLSQNVK